MKQHVGISRDHSGSMQNMTTAAMKDYNNTIAELRNSGSVYGIETILSVVRCGDGSVGRVGVETVTTDILRIQPLTTYPARAPGTPLWDSVAELIRIFETHPDANNPDVSFLVMAITDGGENASKTRGTELAEKIRRLIATDRWTFVFRVPRGYGKEIRNLGISEGNIQEWDTTSKGLETSTQHTTQAFSNYYQARSTGVRSTGTFFADIGSVDRNQVKAALNDISHNVKPYAVVHDGEEIRPFLERVRGSYEIGTAHYELTKSELVQENKKILVVDTKTGAVYTGYAARDLIGLPRTGTVRLRPGNLGIYKVYIQSTSVNRKLVAGTLLYYYRG
jgi:hypothetical protein